MRRDRRNILAGPSMAYAAYYMDQLCIRALFYSVMALSNTQEAHILYIPATILEERKSHLDATNISLVKLVEYLLISLQNEFVIECLKFILGNSFFGFNENVYQLRLQNTWGTRWRTRMPSVSFANPVKTY